jgi:superfamily II DNA or RNA helicase
MTKDDVQQKAIIVWNESKRGLLAMATGTGKSKIAIDEAKREHKIEKTSFKAILIVPTTKLRDVTWAEEFTKWKALGTWIVMDKYCYASIAKIKGKSYDLVILDEAHYLTEANYKFFKQNKIKNIMALTATPPEDPVKRALLDTIAPVVFRYKLEEAETDGLIAPFNITVIEFPLDTSRKNIKSGTKTKPFMQTEKAKYDYLCTKISRMYYSNVSADVKKWAYFDRMRFIYNLPSKTRLAQQVIKNRMSGRYLVFGGSIDQINTLMHPYVYHSKTVDTYYNKFLNKEISSLGAVKALNEGQNIPDLDMILVVQLNSKELDIIQRIGRVVRWREGHTAEVIILIASGTKDEEWLQKALQGFDESKITFKKAYHV